VGYQAYLARIVDEVLDQARDAGVSVRRILDWGSGPVAAASNLLRERGLEVYSYDPLYAPQIPERKDFDLVLCIEVAEHFRSPLEDFLTMASHARPGGLLAVRTLFVPEGDESFASWWYKEDRTHLSFYSEKALSILGSYASMIPHSYKERALAVFRRPGRVLVAGGANMDIQGRPWGPFRPSDSLPGSVRFSPGGAGRNVAEALSRCGLPVSFFSAVGDDPSGRELARLAEDAGLDFSLVSVRVGVPSGAYLAILDDQGDLAAAVCSAEAVESLGVEDALRMADAFVERSGGPPTALVLDGNLLPPCAEALLDAFPTVPAWLDPVSVEKGLRFSRYRGGALLPRLFGIKPNLVEAAAIASLGDQVSPSALIAAIQSLGVSRVHLSLGAQGIAYADSLGAATHRFVPPDVIIASATGAGDSYLASAVRARVLDRSTEESVILGCACAALALSSEWAVPPTLTAVAVERLAAQWRRRDRGLGKESA